MNNKNLTFDEKLEKARRICEEMGTKIVFVTPNKSANQCRVVKQCTVDPSHAESEVSLNSIANQGRGGCATCARKRGGQKSKRGPALRPGAK